MANKDLFGEKASSKRRFTKLEKSLRDYDMKSFDDRLTRLKYIHKIFPKGYSFFGQMDLLFTFEEAKHSFINGQYIGAIVLAQSFIEKMFNSFFAEQGHDKIAKRGLREMISFGKENKLIHEFILDKADNLRQIRNPFIHLKDYNYPHTLVNRMLINRTQPHQQLESDAKEAINIMSYIATHKF